MKISYRPEIDGLRAIAVGAVILYHAKTNILGIKPFEGGFIGVDIFFVISGYLITSILLKELFASGSISFSEFYKRRIRRILPALLLVKLVSLPFAWMFLLPSSFLDFSKSILYSLGFSSNFYFWKSGQVYGAESGLLKPFLHTWSLSVEEQFYILFPLVLLISFRFFKKYLFYILILGLILSLGIADWGSKNFGGFNFYVLPTRVWELLAGSSLAYLEIKLGGRKRKNNLQLILPSIGFILILHSVVFFNDETFHPSLYTLSPIIGVCLIIWFSNKDEIITKLLSTKLFVKIGLISYSLYLWHYPIFAFDRITEFSENDIAKNFIVMISIVILSFLSYFYVERPARQKKYNFKSVFLLLIGSYLILIFFSTKIIFEDGAKDRFPKILDVRKTEILRDPKSLKRCNYGEVTSCYFNQKSNKKNVYIIGDSQAGRIMPDLKKRIVKKDYGFITSIYPGCFYFPKFEKKDNKSNKIESMCKINLQSEILSKTSDSIIIFFGRLPLYLSNNFFNNLEGGIEKENLIWEHTFISKDDKLTIEEAFKNGVLDLVKNNKVILVYPFPEAGWNVPKKLLNILPKNNDLINEFLVKDNFITTSYKVYKDRTETSFKLLDSIQNKNIFRVYPHKLFCSTIIKNRCLTHDNENIFYSDESHPSSKGAEMLNDLIMSEINKIEVSN
jgi:peptidoglycan/LPS O-acetylase OafA/YrhL